jgi:hypothetical protein
VERRRVAVGRRAILACALAAGGVTAAGCGGGERQDAHEPKGNFKVSVVKASFPPKQSLAQRSSMVIAVKNVDNRTVPNLAITVNSFEYKQSDPTLADAKRPRFVVNRAPRGGDTAYVNTYALGPLKPGQTKRFEWSVTAVKPGPFKISYRIAAGLNGKAKAVRAGGGAVGGTFTGDINSKAPKSKVADDGKTVVTSDN